jgi:hypothetical protein
MLGCAWELLSNERVREIGGTHTLEHFLYWGTALGVVFGTLHAPIVYRSRIADEGASPARAAYFAAWAFTLWALFGAYLLAFWLIGAAGIAVSRLKPGTEAGT